MTGAGTPNVPSMPDGPVAWDALFRECGDDYYFGREPSQLALTAFGYWAGARGEERGSLLDLGCGEGRDAVFFARQGFTVTAVDGSETALRKAERLAAEMGVSATFLRHDLRSFLLPDPLPPFLLANNCLQFLGESCLPLLGQLQAQTPSGGFHAVSAFTREEVAPQAGLYRFDRNELKFHYRDWQVLSYLETIVWRERSQRYLSFAQIVARRP